MSEDTIESLRAANSRLEKVAEAARERLEKAEEVCRHVEARICDAHGIEPCGEHPKSSAATVGGDTWALIVAWRHTIEPLPSPSGAGQEPSVCKCELRARQWNPATGQCETCGCWIDAANRPFKSTPPPASDTLREGTGNKPPLQLNISPEWIKKMAEREGNGCISVGGLMVDMQRSDAEEIEVEKSIQASRPPGEDTITLVHSDDPVTLAECAPGFFLFEGAVGFKSEYLTDEGNVEAFCDSGEAFWGGTNNFKDRDALKVTPLAVVPPSEAKRSIDQRIRDAVAGERERAAGILRAKIAEHDATYNPDEFPDAKPHRDFCECFGVTTLEELETAIRSGGKGNSNAAD